MAQSKISLPRIGLVLALAALAGACTPSPLYFSSAKRPGTGGEIPRDGRGEPIWSAIRPVTPVGTVPPAAPVAPATH